jgi:hypothetical protein
MQQLLPAFTRLGFFLWPPVYKAPPMIGLAIGGGILR